VQVRITTSSNGKTTTIRIEGRLGALEANELLEECRSADQPLRLNLKGLRSVDDAGARALRSLQADGAELIDASVYIQQLLTTITVASRGKDNE
jgi:anti-anti-sigma regulatory factor